MKNLKGLCRECKKRKECKRLCLKAEKYADQDYGARDRDEIIVERNIENIEEQIDYDIYYEDWPPNYQKAKWRTAVINLHKDGLSSGHIAYHVPYTTRQIRRIIAEFKKGRTF